MKFRPCIDLHQGKVKQIVGSTLRDDGAVKENFVSEKNAAWYAQLYRKDNLSGGHIIKLGSGNDEEAMSALAAWPSGMQVGGNITADNAKVWLDNGASAIIITSYVFNAGTINIENLRKVSGITGRERLVLDLSCRIRDGQYYIVTDRWQQWTSQRLDRALFEHLSQFSFEFLIHAADVEGKMAGPDRRLLEIISKDCPVPCVYAGGISSKEDIQLMHTLNSGAKAPIDFTVGSALDIFGGSGLRYQEVKWYIFS